MFQVTKKTLTKDDQLSISEEFSATKTVRFSCYEDSIARKTYKPSTFSMLLMTSCGKAEAIAQWNQLLVVDFKQVSETFRVLYSCYVCHLEGHEILIYIKGICLVWEVEAASCGENKEYRASGNGACCLLWWTITRLESDVSIPALP